MSTTFGVIICTECSGCHRSLQNGTLSSVKPIDATFSAVELGVNYQKNSIRKELNINYQKKNTIKKRCYHKWAMREQTHY